MPKIMHKGVAYGGGGSGGGDSVNHVKVTQAEYDALVAAGTVDSNVVYFIPDGDSDGSDSSVDITEGTITATTGTLSSDFTKLVKVGNIVNISGHITNNTTALNVAIATISIPPARDVFILGHANLGGTMTPIIFKVTSTGIIKSDFSAQVPTTIMFAGSYPVV